MSTDKQITTNFQNKNSDVGWLAIFNTACNYNLLKINAPSQTHLSIKAFLLGAACCTIRLAFLYDVTYTVQLALLLLQLLFVLVVSDFTRMRKFTQQDSKGQTKLQEITSQNRPIPFHINNLVTIINCEFSNHYCENVLGFKVSSLCWVFLQQMHILGGVSLHPKLAYKYVVSNHQT